MFPERIFSIQHRKNLLREAARKRKNPTDRWKLIRDICCFKRFALGRKHKRFTNMYYRGQHPRCPRMDIRRSRVEHGRSKNPDSWRAAEGTDAGIYGPLLGISYVLDFIPAGGSREYLTCMRIERDQSILEKSGSLRICREYTLCSN